MIVTETSSCENCGTTFICDAQNISNCQCSAVQLTELERKYIATKFSGCLCGSCLRQLQNQFQQMGVYYIENGFHVFTEKFLLARGFCCRNRCRHCPYKREAEQA